MTDLFNPDAPAIETKGLGKRFGAQWAVSGVDLRVAAGQVYGFLGRNGAGKTTTIRMLLGLLRPSQGTACIFGHDVTTDRLAAARLTGSLLEARATYDHLSGRDNLDLTRRLLNLPADEIDRTLEIVDLKSAAGKKAGHYSLGMRQRLGLARALLGRPRLVILDEPMNGLDPDGIRDMRAIIRDLPDRSGATVFLSSHLLSEVEQTASHIGLMQDGQMVLQGPIHDLLAPVPVDVVIRTTNLQAAEAVMIAAGYAPIAERDGWRVRLTGGDAEAAALNRRLIEAGCEVIELTLRRGTLESLYLQVQQSRKEAA